MNRLRNFVPFAVFILVIGVNALFLDAQVTSLTKQSASISLNLAMKKDQLAVGQKPFAVVTIKNISTQKIYLSDASSRIRIRVFGKDGESPLTERHRHIRGDFRSGDGPSLGDGPVVGQDIEFGASGHRIFDISGYYDLSTPGKYSVYVELYDPLGPQEGSGIWVRTNTAAFEILAPAQ